MKVTILRIEGCPNWELAVDRVREAAARHGARVDVDIRAVTVDDDPEAMGFTGSPTILVEGRNAFGGQATGNLACRVYETDAGTQGAPSVDQIADALFGGAFRDS